MKCDLIKILFLVNTLFDDIDDDPDLVEKECLEIFNSYSGKADEGGSKIEIVVGSEEYESAMQAKKRTAHSTMLTSDHTVLREKTLKKAKKVRSAQEVMMERYKTVEKPKENVQSPPPAPAPILGLSSKFNVAGAVARKYWGYAF